MHAAVKLLGSGARCHVDLGLAHEVPIHGGNLLWQQVFAVCQVGDENAGGHDHRCGYQGTGPRMRA